VRRFLTALVVLGACAAASAAPIPRDRLDAERVVGTWRMTLGAQGQTDTHLELDFFQSGRMVIRQALGPGRVSMYVGSYRMVGNQLPYEVKQGVTLKAETLTVTKLTATELIIVDPDGLKEEFVRVSKEPKKDDKK